jgi:hypothetical protein
MESPNPVQVNVVPAQPQKFRTTSGSAAGFRANVGGNSPDGQWIAFRLEGPGLVPTS